MTEPDPWENPGLALVVWIIVAVIAWLVFWVVPATVVLSLWPV